MTDFDTEMEEALLMLGEGFSVQMMQWAQKNHPWDNQTHDLERSITPFHSKEKDKVVFGIAEGMDYGKWVERMKDKGVLDITKEHFMPAIQAKTLERIKQVFLKHGKEYKA